MTKKQKASSRSFQPPKALTLKQADLIQAINSKEMIITTGPAGVGKSYLTAAYAAYFYHLGKVDRIILARPNIAIGKSIGFLPGFMEEKMIPWAIPILSTLEDYLSVGEVETMMKNNKLEIVPFEYIRGRSWDNSFIILDEAQNSTVAEMKAFVTRIGEGSTTIINGDETQTDIKERNGLSYLTHILGNDENHELYNKVGSISFTSKDIVRSGLCQLWVQAFERE